MLRFPRSRRLSRRSRSVSAVIGSAAVLWMVWMFVFEGAMPRPEKIAALPTERLSFAKLAPDEEIVVVITGYRRSPIELRFRRDGAETKLIVSAIAWSGIDRTWKMARVIDVRPLSAAEAAGLDAVVTHLRAQNDSGLGHAAVYEIEHRRVESTLAREKLSESVSVHLFSNLKLFPSDDVEAKPELERTAARAGVSSEDLAKWVTFEMLVNVDANAEDAERDD